jgi:hypothetical protein
VLSGSSRSGVTHGADVARFSRNLDAVVVVEVVGLSAIHRTLHYSEETASTTAPKEVPDVARRLQLLQVWGVLANASAVHILASQLTSLLQ